MTKRVPATQRRTATQPATRTLTPRLIEAAHTTRHTLTERRELPHHSIGGLKFVVGPHSSTWRLWCRIRGGKPFHGPIGDYPEMSLEQAEDAALRIQRNARKGIDPRDEERERLDAERQAEIEAALRQASSFAVAVAAYLAANAHRDAAGLSDTTRNLKHATDAFGAVPLADVTKAQIMALVAKRTRDGKYAANATFSDIRACLNWCVGQGRLDVSPMLGLVKPHKVQPRDVYLSPDELRAVWRAAEREPYPFGSWVQMLIASGGQRRQDVSQMRWRDVGKLDLQERNSATGKLETVTFEHVWRDVDPSKPKQGQRVHEVPLNALAQSILRNVPRFLHGQFVFSGSDGVGPISGYSKAVERLRTRAGIGTHWSPHVLRHTCATLMAEHCGALPDEVAMVQNRVSGFLRGAERVYQHSTFIRRKQRLLDDWGAFLTALLADDEQETQASETA